MSSSNLVSPSTERIAYGTLKHESSDEEVGRQKQQDSYDHNPDKDTPKLTTWQRCVSLLKNNALIVLLVAALVVGVSLGAGLRAMDTPLTRRQQVYLRFPGDLLMSMLQLLILPLIVTSLISGLTSLDMRTSSRLGACAVAYYLTTTLVAVLVGVALVLAIQPGSSSTPSTNPDHVVTHVDALDTLLDLVRQMFPDNIIEACFSKTLTEIKVMNVTSPDGSKVTQELVPVLKQQRGINMLGLVVSSIAMGVAINSIGAKGRPLKDVIEATCAATLTLVAGVIWYSPLGVMFLVAAQVVEIEDLGETFQQLGLYFLTVVLGLLIHGCVVLPLMYFVIVRDNPYRFALGMTQAMVTALGTSSSSATLPVTMRNLEHNNGLDPRVISFVAPVGATINMDGTALYEAVAVVFIGQMNGFDLDLGSVVIICLTATAAAIGAAGVPQAGLVTMVIVLTAVGFPTDDVGMILAVDWLLDRLRTMVNVLGDSFGAGIVNHISRKDLRGLDQEEEGDRQRLCAETETSRT